MRLQRAKIKIFAAQRKAARNQSEDHEEDLKRLEEMKDQIELLELENIITQQGPDSLSPEQVQRLGLLRYRELQQLRAMLSQKNPVNLSFDETLRLKELLALYKKVHLTPLELHRFQEQLKRHKLFTRRDQEYAKLQELRGKLKATGPSS